VKVVFVGTTGTRNAHGRTPFTVFDTKQNAGENMRVGEYRQAVRKSISLFIKIHLKDVVAHREGGTE
jgi:hypothetical protein